MKSIDIHNHIVYGVDDGAQTVEDTLSLLRQAVDDGIEKIVLTPHFIENRFENTKDVIEKKKQEIDRLVVEHNLNIEVFYGCEIFITSDSLKKVNNKEVVTLNNSKYVLVETNRAYLYHSYTFDDALYNFRIDGYRPVIAHPERYEEVAKNPNKVHEWVSDGCYIQVNATSLLNNKKESFKVAKKLLDHGLVHVVATDAHDLNYRPAMLSQARKFVTKHYGEQMAEDLFYNNPLKLIQNEPISTDGMKQIKKKSFIFF